MARLLPRLPLEARWYHWVAHAYVILYWALASATTTLGLFMPVDGGWFWFQLVLWAVTVAITIQIVRLHRSAYLLGSLWLALQVSMQVRTILYVDVPEYLPFFREAAYFVTASMLMCLAAMVFLRATLLRKRTAE
jgi:hypothetical protein